MTGILNSTRDAVTDERAHRMLTALSKAQSAALVNRDFQSLAEDLLSIFLDTTQSAFGFFAEVLHDDEGAANIRAFHVTNIAWDEETEELYQKHKQQGLTFHELNSLWRKVVTTEKPVITNSPSEDARATGTPEGHPRLTSFLGLPIFCDGSLTGVVSIANRDGGYSESDIEFLDPLLKVCAAAIEAVRAEQRHLGVEQQLKKSEERLQLAQAAANLGSWEWNILDDTLTLSAGVYANFGLIDDGTVETFESWQESILPDDRERVLQDVKLSLDNLSPLETEYRISWPDGSIHWMSNKGKVFCDPAGKPVRMLGINADITEQKRLDTQLREMNLAISNAMPASSRLDPNGRYVHVSEPYATITGYTPDELEGQLWQITVLEEDIPAATAVYEEMLRRGRGEREVRGLRKDGSVFFKQILLIRIDDMHNHVAGHYCFMRDIDKQHRAERQVEQLRDKMATVSRLNMMGEMAAGVAHELNQPLAALVNNAYVAQQVLKQKKEGYSGRLNDLLEKLQKQALHAGEIIRGVRKLVRNEAAGRETTDLNTLIEEVLSVFESEAHPSQVQIITE